MEHRGHFATWNRHRPTGQKGWAMRRSLHEHLEDRVLLAGTPRLVADLNTSGLSSWPGEFTVFNNALYFTAYDDQHGRALWKFDGSQTTLAADVDPGNESNPNL